MEQLPNKLFTALLLEYLEDVCNGTEKRVFYILQFNFLSLALNNMAQQYEKKSTRAVSFHILEWTVFL